MATDANPHPYRWLWWAVLIWSIFFVLIYGYMAKRSPGLEVLVYGQGYDVQLRHLGYKVFSSQWTSSLPNSFDYQRPQSKYLVIDLGMINNDRVPRTIPPSLFSIIWGECTR